jgi:hypothetical protein
MSKYKIVISEGCTSFYTTVNDKDISDLTPKEYNEFLDYLCVNLKRQIKNNTVSIQSLIGIFQYDDYIFDKETCEQCGDTNSKTVWKI